MFKTHTDLIFASTLLGLDNTTRIPFRAIDAILDLLHHPGFKPAELTFARSEDVYAAYSSAALTARLRTDVREARISRVVLDLVAEHLAPKLEPFADSLSNSKDQRKRTEEASALENMALVHRSWTEHAQRILRRRVRVIGAFSLRLMLQSTFVVSGTLELKFSYDDADPPDDAHDSCRALAAILQRTPFLRSLFVKMPFDSIDGHSIALLLQELQNLKYLESLWLVQDTYKFNNHLPALCGALPNLPELKNLWIERWCIPREDAPSISLSEEALPACRISSLSYIGKRGDIYMNSYSLSYLFRPRANLSLTTLYISVPELGITGNTFGIFDAVLPTLESLRLCLASTCDEALGAFFAKCTALKHLRLDIDLARYWEHYPFNPVIIDPRELPASLEELHVHDDWRHEDRGFAGWNQIDETLTHLFGECGHGSLQRFSWSTETVSGYAWLMKLNVDSSGPSKQPWDSSALKTCFGGICRCCERHGVRYTGWYERAFCFDRYDEQTF